LSKRIFSGAFFALSLPKTPAPKALPPLKSSVPTPAVKQPPQLPGISYKAGPHEVVTTKTGSVIKSNMAPYGHAPSWEKFSTLGKNPAEVPHGVLQKIIKEIPEKNATKIANEIVSSGVDIPKIVRIVKNTSLYKIVPKGGRVPTGSKYWMTPQTLMNAIKSGKLEQHLGLPLARVAKGYEIYEITPKVDALASKIIIFESKIAPTVEGAYRTTGGGRQIIIPDAGKWTKPVKVYEFTIKK